MARTTLTLLVAFACLATVTGVAAADPVTGTVDVENGTAEGDTVTVTPMDGGFKRVGEPVSTTVRNGRYRASGLPNATMYAVRLQHGNASHYRVVSEPRANFTLSATLSARLVTPDGTPVTDAQLTVLSRAGPPVARLEAGPEGRIELGPLQLNRSYTLRTNRNGAPYRYVLRTGTNATGAELRVRPPTSDGAALRVTGGDPASHVVQPVERNGATTVVERIQFENAADRPFVGPVAVGLPPNATVRSVAIQDQQLRHRRTADGVAVNASLAPGSQIRVTVRYELPDGRLAKPVLHDTDSLVVVLQGYDADRVEYADELRLVNRSGMPIPMLTTTAGLSAGDRIAVTLPGGTSGGGEEGGPMPRFPATVFAVALLAVVGGGIAVYRVV
ncbi:hypothetical protein BV210_07525 [Halorientalis sp. IM1011]|uniref:hypothetical protein n=1 Tax=Halorientalis sp. IM1011 TaxID=1932360 RepID=UPI00097CD449|nr:hypothetical protein [Halorientalis sp. IM1011]AQL42566.1 hypothetical protein BV210_07525 [Halorientalis sp. IM1011]